MNTRIIGIIIIVSMITLLFGLYGVYGTNYVMELSLLPIKNTKLELNLDGSYSFNGYIKNIGNVNCRAVLLTEGITWNYTGKPIYVDHTHCIRFTIYSISEEIVIKVGEKRF